jgi:hypothetical protein
MTRCLKRHAIPILGIVGMVLAMHWPLVLNLDTHFVGRPFEDAVAVIWEFWWADQAVTERGVQVLYTPDVYYPHGYHVASDAHPIWWLLVFAPLTHGWGALLAYNLALLSTFVTGGVGVYLLVATLTGRRLAGMVAAPVYVFAPIVTVRLGGHLNVLLGMQWLPWLALCAHQALTRDGRAGWMYSVLSGLCYALAATGSWYFVFIGFVPLCSAFLFAAMRPWKTQWLKLAVALMVCAFLVAPFAVLTFKANRAMFGGNLAFALSESDTWSASVDRLLAPNPLNPGWDVLWPHRPPVRGEQDAVSLGYAASLLAVLGAWKSRDAFKRAFVALFFVSLILAMGTTCHWQGQRVALNLSAPWSGVYDGLTGWLTAPVTDAPAIPLPGLLLARSVPFYAMMRGWCRFMIPAMLGLAVLAGYGAALMQSRLGYGRWSMLLVVGVVFAEGIVTPFAEFTSVATARRPVDEWLARQPPGTAIIEYPWPAMNKTALYGQTIHGQPVVNGQAPHTPQYLQPFPQVRRTWPDAAAVQVLRDWDVRYILLTVPDLQGFSGGPLPQMMTWPDVRWVAAFPMAGGWANVHVFEIH